MIDDTMSNKNYTIRQPLASLNNKEIISGALETRPG